MLANLLAYSQSEVNITGKQNIDLAVVISFAALFLSAVTPLISALINGHFRIKEKKLDAESESRRHHLTFYKEHRSEVIENYIRSTSAQIVGESTEIESDYIAAMGEVFLYIDTSLWYLIEKIDKELNEMNVESAKETLTILCKQLADNHIRT